MVVLLILAILLAIAIPTFLGVTKSANDRATQTNLNTALVNGKSIFQNNGQSYALTTPVAATNTTNLGISMAGSLFSAQPNLTFQTGAVASTGSGSAQVSVAVSSDGANLALAEQARGTATCWYVVDNSTGSISTPAPWSLTSTTSGPITVGTWYGEFKNSGNNCSAASLQSSGATGVYWSQGTFPNQ